MTKTAELSEAAQKSNLLLTELRQFMSQSHFTQTPLRADTLNFGKVVINSYTPNQTEIFLDLPKASQHGSDSLDQIAIGRSATEVDSDTSLADQSNRVRVIAFRNRNLACDTIGGYSEPVAISADQIKTLVAEIKECLGEN